MTAARGWFVVDQDAKRADETGSAEELGVRGLVVDVHHGWVNQQTGEIEDRLIVATRRYGQLRFAELPASDVADGWVCGRIDAAGFEQVAKRAVARAKRSPDPRHVDVLALATQIKAAPASPPVGHVPSVFPTDEETAAYDAAHPDEAAGWRLRDKPADLAALLEQSTAAHHARKEAS